MSSGPGETNKENSSEHRDQTEAHRECCKPPSWRLAWIALSFDQPKVRTVGLATVTGSAIQRCIIPVQTGRCSKAPLRNVVLMKFCSLELVIVANVPPHETASFCAATQFVADGVKA